MKKYLFYSIFIALYILSACFQSLALPQKLWVDLDGQNKQQILRLGLLSVIYTGSDYSKIQLTNNNNSGNVQGELFSFDGSSVNELALGTISNHNLKLFTNNQSKTWLFDTSGVFYPSHSNAHLGSSSKLFGNLYLNGEINPSFAANVKVGSNFHLGSSSNTSIGMEFGNSNSTSLATPYFDYHFADGVGTQDGQDYNIRVYNSSDKVLRIQSITTGVIVDLDGTNGAKFIKEIEITGVTTSTNFSLVAQYSKIGGGFVSIYSSDGTTPAFTCNQGDTVYNGNSSGQIYVCNNSNTWNIQ